MLPPKLMSNTCTQRSGFQQKLIIGIRLKSGGELRTYYVERGKCGGTHQKPPPNRLLARGGLGLNKKLKRRRNWTTIFYGIIISPHMNERLKNLKFCRDLALMPGKRHVQPAIQLCDNSSSLFQTDYFPFMDSE